MASKQVYGIPAPYTPLLHAPTTQVFVFLTPYYLHLRASFLRHRRCFFFSSAAILLLLSTAAFFMYPSDPDISLSRIRINYIIVRDSPKLAIDLSFSLTIKVRNRDFFSLDYDSLVISVGYRDKELGLVKSRGGHLRARDSTYIDATLDLNDLEVYDVIYMISDLGKGIIPFDTIAWVKGDLGFFSSRIPSQGKVSCEVYVNVNNQTISHQDCRSGV